MMAFVTVHIQRCITVKLKFFGKSTIQVYLVLGIPTFICAMNYSSVFALAYVCILFFPKNYVPLHTRPAGFKHSNVNLGSSHIQYYNHLQIECWSGYKKWTRDQTMHNYHIHLGPWAAWIILIYLANGIIIFSSYLSQ